MRSVRLPRAAVHPFLLALLAACATPDAQGPPATVTDSAGVAVVVNRPTPASAPVLRLADEPARVLGGADSDVNLFRVAGVHPLDGGRTAVINGSSQEILVFDDAGTLVRRVGGAGDGPGEFRRLSAVVVMPDGRLGGFDARGRRVTVFEDDGTPAGLVTPDGLPEGVRGRFFVEGPRWVWFGDGAFEREMSMVGRAMVESIAYDTSGRVVARYGPFPGDELFAGTDLGAVIFGAVLRGTLTGGRLVVGDSDAAEVRVFDDSGRLERVVRWPEPDREVTEALVDEWLRNMAMGAPEERRATVEERLREMVPRGDVLPAFDRIVPGDDGTFWVGRYDDPGQAVIPLGPQSMSWMEFDADGTIVARLHTPDGFELHRVVDGRAVGVHFDDADVETVRTYPLERD